MLPLVCPCLLNPFLFKCTHRSNTKLCSSIILFYNCLSVYWKCTNCHPLATPLTTIIKLEGGWEGGWGVSDLDIYQTRCNLGCSSNTFVTDWLSHSLAHPLWIHLENTFTPKPYELESWNFKRRFTLPPCHASCVVCHVSCVTRHVSHVMCP